MPPWPAEEIEQLKDLWISGISSTLIANQLPGRSRNAVIGKANRLIELGQLQPRGNRGTERRRVAGHLVGRAAQS